MKSNELKQKRAGLVTEARKILDVAESEKRDVNAEERQKFDAMMADVDVMKGDIDRAEALETAERSTATQIESTGTTQEETTTNPLATESYRSGYRRYLTVGKNGLNSDEVRALQVGTDSEGGYIVPEEFETQIVKSLQENNIIRQIATVISTNSDRNIPIESSISTAAWVSEEGAISTSSDPAFGRATLGAHKAALIVKVSRELIDDGSFDVESYTAGQIGEAIGILEEAAMAAGDGSGKPTGVSVTGTTGVTAASTSAITPDELIDLYYSVIQSCRNKGTFIAKDATIKAIRKLKDSDNQYLWQPGLQAGAPDMLLGRPIYACDGLPAMGAAAKVMAFGDFSKYLIADRGGRSTQILGELYAANDQVGVKVTQRVDGKLLQAAAIKTLLMAAS